MLKSLIQREKRTFIQNEKLNKKKFQSWLGPVNQYYGLKNQVSLSVFEYLNRILFHSEKIILLCRKCNYYLI